MASQESNRMNRKYSSLSCLLLFFLEDTYLPYEERNDVLTIKRFIKESHDEVIIDSFEQGKEILALQDFPSEWIEETSNRLPFDKGPEATPEDYYDWTKWIVDTLEVEAKKAGKL